MTNITRLLKKDKAEVQAKGALPKIKRWLNKHKGPFVVTTAGDANKLLRGSMAVLVKHCAQLVVEHDDPDTMHLEICHKLSDEFNLWEGPKGHQCFPLWLSRVVEGSMRDNGRQSV